MEERINSVVIQYFSHFIQMVHDVRWVCHSYKTNNFSSYWNTAKNCTVILFAKMRYTGKRQYLINIIVIVEINFERDAQSWVYFSKYFG